MGIGQYGNRDKVSFDEFIRMIDRGKAIHDKYARGIPSHEIQDSRTNARFNGNPQFENAKLSVLKKAYELGMIGFDGVLKPSDS